MSLYCKGDGCARCEECLRVEAWEEFPNKDIEPGFASGLWLVNEAECQANNYKDGVFKIEKI